MSPRPDADEALASRATVERPAAPLQPARPRLVASLLSVRNWQQLGKLCVVGAVGYLINLAVYDALLHAGLHYLVAATCPFLVAVTSNYPWHRPRLRREGPSDQDAARAAAAARFAHAEAGVRGLRAVSEGRVVALALSALRPQPRGDVRREDRRVDGQDLVGRRRRDRPGHGGGREWRRDGGVDGAAGGVGDGTRLAGRVRRHRHQQPVGLGRVLPRLSRRARRLAAAVLAPQPRPALPPLADRLALVLQPRRRVHGGAALLPAAHLG